MNNISMRAMPQSFCERSETMMGVGRKPMDEEENVSSSQDPTEDLKQYRQFMNDLNTQNKSGQNVHASIIAGMPASQQHAAGHKSLGNLHSNSSYG